MLLYYNLILKLKNTITNLFRLTIKHFSSSSSLTYSIKTCLVGLFNRISFRLHLLSVVFFLCQILLVCVSIDKFQ